MKAISLRLSTLIVVLAIGLTQSASASNPVIDWNQIALTTALTTPGTQIYLTYVNLAMYDAVNAIDGRYQQYAPEFHGPRDASREAAAISAAYQVLLYYFPAQAAALQVQYDAAIAAIPDGEAKGNGIAVGQVAAASIVAMRAGDGRAANVTYTYPSSPQPGVWIPTPPGFGPPVTPWVATDGSFHHAERFPVPAGERSAILGQPPMGPGVQRGQTTRRGQQQRPDTGTNRNCSVLDGESSGHLFWRLRSVGGGSPSQPLKIRQIACYAVGSLHGWRHWLFQRQISLQQLASSNCNSKRRDRRESGDRS